MSTITVDQHEADPFLLFRQEANNGVYTYAAGFPGYPAHFPRDTLIAAILANNAHLLVSQLKVSALYQGEVHDPVTGERPGKIHHEMPGAQLDGRGENRTTYNACDTTPLFLIALEGLANMDHEAYVEFVESHHNHISKAINHVTESVSPDNGLYWDDTVTKETGYALRVTYWKDSILPHADGKEEPDYPVSFAQAHFMAARGVLAAGRILQDPTLEELADRMYRDGIRAFITSDHFTVYRDQSGELQQNSSDELHSLAYIPDSYAALLPLDAIRTRARNLATPIGYMCTEQSVSQHLSDTYHGDKVWVFEQALIHYGSQRFGLHSEAETAANIAGLIGDGQELFGIVYDDNGGLTPVPEGNNLQLWSVAARSYFANTSKGIRPQWL